MELRESNISAEQLDKLHAFLRSETNTYKYNYGNSPTSPMKRNQYYASIIKVESQESMNRNKEPYPTYVVTIDIPLKFLTSDSERTTEKIPKEIYDSIIEILSL